MSSREGLPIFGTEENRAKLMAIYDEALRQWPVPLETSFVLTRYGKTHVIATGDPASPPLVMTHPAAVGGFVWSSIIDPLSEKHRVYALDTIGDFGRSELTDPERYPKKGRDYKRLARRRVRAARDHAGGCRRGIDGRLDRDEPRDLRSGPGASPRPTRPDGAPTLARHARRPRPVRVVCDATDRRQVRANHLPCLGVILGGKDGLVGNAAAAAKRARNIPNCEIEILPQAGHIMSVDEPEVVANRIAAFLGHAP